MRLNEISSLNIYNSTLVSTYFKKVDCITGEKFTESRGFGASFINYNYANTIYINGSENLECIEKIRVPFCIIIWVQGGKIDAKQQQ